MPGVAEHIWQVLVQRPATGDIEHLDAAADAENRQSPLERAPQQREFQGVAGGARRVRFRMRLLAVSGRVEVITPGDHQAIQAVEHPVGNAGVAWLRRQQQRDATGGDDALEVIGGQITRLDVPAVALHPLQITGQTDDRPRPRGVQSHASSPSR
jgi:hypothetical protein